MPVNKWLAGGLLIAALIGAVLWYRSDAIAAHARADQIEKARADAVDANAALMTTVSYLQARNASLIEAMDQRNEEIKQKAESLNEARAELDRLSEEVQIWRSGGVPGDIDRLLNPTAGSDTCGANASAVIAARADGVVVLSRQAHRYQW